MAGVMVEWQPITGCSYASPGCAHCRTIQLAGPDLRLEFERDGLVKASKAGPVWTGRLRFSEERLAQPLGWAEPATVFVNPHGDLFHENASDEWLDRIFDVMERAIWHNFQVLTKRAGRMRSYVTSRYADSSVPGHIHLGVSCERQREADERVPELQATKAALRFITLYPLLEPIDLSLLLSGGGIAVVMAGDEPERPADQLWVRGVAEQCAMAGVPFHFSRRLIGEAA